MHLTARFTLLFALSACTAQRPEGAYTPTPQDDDAVPSGFEQTDAGDVEPDELPDDESDAEDPPADATMDPPADTAPPNPSDPLAKVAGRYLMRMDYYSTATATSGTNTLTLQNRVSNLFFTELKLVDGTLQATEQLCDQTYDHHCVKGCTDWKTAVDPELPAKFRKMRPTPREYAIDEQGMLRVEKALLPLGYDDLDPSISTVPSRYTDANVWKLGADMEATRVGVRTFITADLQALGAVSIKFTCLIDLAQLFGTEFKANLASIDAAGLTADAISVVADSHINALYFEGNPMMYCNSDTVATGTTKDETAFVRFKTAGSLTGCPTSAAAFEAAFPANPKFR